MGCAMAGAAVSRMVAMTIFFMGSSGCLRQFHGAERNCPDAFYGRATAKNASVMGQVPSPSAFFAASRRKTAPR
jgi:hypothetical protein